METLRLEKANCFDAYSNIRWSLGLSKIIRVKYENGVLKPLEPLELEEGEEARIQLLPEEFPELMDRVSIEARSDVDKVLREARERRKRWY